MFHLTKMNRLTSIQILDATVLPAVCEHVQETQPTFDTFYGAGLFIQSLSGGRNTGCEKVDYVATWENGTEHRGSYELVPGCRVDLAISIKNYLQFLATGHRSSQQVQRAARWVTAEMATDAKEKLDTLLFEDSNTTQHTEFHIVDPWGEGRRFLKEIDSRPGLADDERVIGTFEAGLAQRFPSAEMANYQAADIRPAFPRATVRKVTAVYSIT